MEQMKLAIASDHAGFKMKEELKHFLIDKGHKVTDFGTNSDASMDYPDTAHPLAAKVDKGEFKFGITICGSGNGINMTANKYKGIRAALCWNVEISKLARQHNNANICSLPARFVDIKLAREIVEAFLTTSFEGGRHQQRIDKIPIKK